MSQTESAPNTSSVNLTQEMPNDTNTVVKTNKVESVVIPILEGSEEKVRNEVKDLQQKYAELVSEKFNIPIADILKCTPDNIVYEVRDSIPDKPDTKPKKVQKNSINKLTINNWDTAESIDELKTLKLTQLKDILSSKSMKTVGSKTVLIERVWGIIHPEEAPKEEPKKQRGRPRSKTNKTDFPIVDDSDSEIADAEEDIQNLLTNTIERTINGQILDIVESKGWVFSKSGDEVEWLGTLNSDGENYTEVDPPDELLKLYGSD